MAARCVSGFGSMTATSSGRHISCRYSGFRKARKSLYTPASPTQRELTPSPFGPAGLAPREKTARLAGDLPWRRGQGTARSPPEGLAGAPERLAAAGHAFAPGGVALAPGAS